MSSEKTNEALFQRRAEAIPKGPFNVAPIFADHAKGAEIWDVEGKRYLDFAGGIGTLNVGHNHPMVVEAIQKQAESLIHSCWHVVMYEPYLRLAERLNELAPIPGTSRTVFFNSGAEAVENAVKISRIFTKRNGVIAFERGFHGRTLLGMSLTGKVKPYSYGFGPFAPEIYHLPYRPFFAPPPDWSDERIEAAATEALLDLFHYQIDATEIACVVLEPVLGEGGFYPIHPVAMKVLRQVSADNQIVFISDEVQSGFGRCGAIFACERYGVEPDLITAAKSLAGGMPLSAVIGKAEIMDAPHVGGIGGTYGGNPVACAAANAVLDVIESENLVERGETIGKRVMEAFRELEQKHDFIGSVRGLGAMCALDIRDPKACTADPVRTADIIATARDRGLLLISASGNVIRTLMPLVITDDQLEEGLEILSKSLAA